MKLALVLVAVALAAFPATASADTSTLGYTDAAGSANDILRVSNGDVDGFQVSYGTGCFFGCSFNIESLQGFTDATGGRCTPITAPTSFECDAEAGGSVQVPGNINITGNAGGDNFEGNCFLSSPTVTLNAGAGDDRLTLGFLCVGSHVINLEAGNDTAVAAGAVSGGPGNDRLQGIAVPDPSLHSNDVFDGGDGRDTLEGGDGVDTLRGGAGRDLLVPGIGNGDVVEGGADIDTASYEDRTGGQAVIASLDGQANDGENGEGDRIAADVENLIGGSGDDTLNGDGAPNDIDGGDGGDVINPGGGPDFVDGGTGNDRIEARDGAQDRVICGDGNDLAITDEFDTVIACETVQASRELMPDVDNDGVPAPADCDDRDGRRRPGFTDRPGNGIDEDCSGADAPFTRILSPVQSTFSTAGAVTRVLRLRVLAVPEGGRVELRCTPAGRRGCFRGVKRFRSPRGREQLNIRGPVRRSRLRTGARLEVRVRDADSIGKVVRFTMRRGKLPSSRTLCLVPGRRSPGRCPRS